MLTVCLIFVHRNDFCLFLFQADPHLSPSSPILLYPVNRTFSITCSLLCDTFIDIEKIIWLVNGQGLYEDRHQYHVETISFNTQRLTVFLNKKTNHFIPANYTCRYNGKESSVLVRRRTSKSYPFKKMKHIFVLFQKKNYIVYHDKKVHHLLIYFNQYLIEVIKNIH